MSAKYEIYADEGWTHGGQPPNRYWCFFGGIFGEEAELARLNTELQKIKAAHAVNSEIKWTKVGANNITCCQAMVDCLFWHIRASKVKYRQFFVDRALVWTPANGGQPDDDLTVQFKMYYQFLKHAFGLRYLPRNVTSGQCSIMIRLDDHPSPKHKKDLVEFAERLPLFLHRLDLQVSVSFLNSGKHERLQICDLLMGAAGFYGNRHHEHRKPGQRGMSEKQRLKKSLAWHIYTHLRNLDAEERGSKNFNWFESTGLQGNQQNLFNYKARIWKFQPAEHQRDLGWHQSNLERHGGYAGPKLAPAPTSNEGKIPQ